MQETLQIIAALSSHLPLPNLLIDPLGHLCGLGKHKDSRGHAVESVNGMQLLQIVLFAQDEDDRVVTKPAAGVYWQRGGFVHDHHLIVLHQDLDRLGCDWRLMAMHRIPEKIVILQDRWTISMQAAWVTTPIWPHAAGAWYWGRGGKEER